MSICNRNRIMTGLRFLFRVTLRRLDLAAEVYHIEDMNGRKLCAGTQRGHIHSCKRFAAFNGCPAYPACGD